MSTLQTLIKLQKSLVDEQRQVLNRLQLAVDAINQKIAELEIEKAREQIAAEKSPESRTTYGAFLQSTAAKGRELEQARRATMRAVDEAHVKLTELFEEQKRYEIAEQQRLQAEMLAEQHRERIELDEIGGTSFERRKKHDELG